MFLFLYDVGEDSFKGVPFTSIVFSSNISDSTIDAIGLTNKKELLSVHFPHTIKKIGVFMFEGCSNLVSITIGDPPKYLLQNGTLDLSSLDSFEIQHAAFSGVTINRIIFVAASVFNRNSFMNVIGLETAYYTLAHLHSPFVLPIQLRDFPELLTIFMANVLISFNGIIDLRNVSEFDRITTLDISTFAEIDSIKSVILPDHVMFFFNVDI